MSLFSLLRTAVVWLAGAGLLLGLAAPAGALGSSPNWGGRSRSGFDG